MASAESTRTSSEIKEHCEKHGKFVGHFLSKERTCAKKGMKVKEKRKETLEVFFFPLFSILKI